MAHRSFGSSALAEAPDESADPITFDLADEKDIGCRPRVNGKLILDLVKKLNSGSFGRQSDGIISIFDACVLRDDGDEPERFTGKPFDPDRPNEYHTAEELREASANSITPGIDPTSSAGRLKTVLDDPDTYIEISELASLVSWLVEQYTARPTPSAASSTPGRTSTSRTSGRGRRSRAGTGEVATLPSAQTSSSESS
jgi:hypothetical protein